MPVSVEEALARIHALDLARRREFVPIEDALGRILAQDVVARHNLPPYDNSAMDGYAVICDDAGGTVRSEHTVLAGDREQIRISNGFAARIMTGARIPEGTECVVPVEAVTVEDDRVRLPDTLTPGQHIRLCGEDIEAGDTLLKPGTALHAHHITLLASQGISHVCVFHKPNIAVFASGSELKMHFESIEAHQLYNTNSPTVAARAAEWGCDVHFIGTAGDSLGALLSHIETALQSDLIVTSGGVSVGDADFTKEAFAHFNFEPLFDSVHIKPGKPTAVGRIGSTLVLNLPGNPMAATLNFELFGQALVMNISGTSQKFHNTIATKMQCDTNVKAGRRTLLPGFYDGQTFRVCEKFAPGMISPLAISNGYIMLDESCKALHAGDDVRFIPTRMPWRGGASRPLISPVE